MLQLIIKHPQQTVYKEKESDKILMVDGTCKNTTV